MKFQRNDLGYVLDCGIPQEDRTGVSLTSPASGTEMTSNTRFAVVDADKYDDLVVALYNAI